MLARRRVERRRPERLSSGIQARCTTPRHNRKRNPTPARGGRRFHTEESAMANPPLLTPEQRQAALEKAAAARRQRAEVKDKLKIGSMSLEELFDQASRGDEAGAMLAKLR